MTEFEKNLEKYSKNNTIPSNIVSLFGSDLNDNQKGGSIGLAILGATFLGGLGYLAFRGKSKPGIFYQNDRMKQMQNKFILDRNIKHAAEMQHILLLQQEQMKLENREWYDALIAKQLEEPESEESQLKPTVDKSKVHSRTEFTISNNEILNQFYKSNYNSKEKEAVKNFSEKNIPYDISFELAEMSVTQSSLEETEKNIKIYIKMLKNFLSDVIKGDIRTPQGFYYLPYEERNFSIIYILHQLYNIFINHLYLIEIINKNIVDEKYESHEKKLNLPENFLNFQKLNSLSSVEREKVITEVKKREDYKQIMSIEEKIKKQYESDIEKNDIESLAKIQEKISNWSSKVFEIQNSIKSELTSENSVILESLFKKSILVVTLLKVFENKIKPKLEKKKKEKEYFDANIDPQSLILRENFCSEIEELPEIITLKEKLEPFKGTDRYKDFTEEDDLDDLKSKLDEIIELTSDKKSNSQIIEIIERQELKSDKEKEILEFELKNKYLIFRSIAIFNLKKILSLIDKIKNEKKENEYIETATKELDLDLSKKNDLEKKELEKEASMDEVITKIESSYYKYYTKISELSNSIDKLNDEISEIKFKINYSKEILSDSDEKKQELLKELEEKYEKRDKIYEEIKIENDENLESLKSEYEKLKTNKDDLMKMKIKFILDIISQSSNIRLRNLQDIFESKMTKQDKFKINFSQKGGRIGISNKNDIKTILSALQKIKNNKSKITLKNPIPILFSKNIQIGGSFNNINLVQIIKYKNKIYGKLNNNSIIKINNKIFYKI